jgi:alginate O-acetyltransferase complex protein AlgI
MHLLTMILGGCIPVVAASWLLPTRWQLWPMPIATAVFLAYFAPVSLGILTATTITSYFILQYKKKLTAATLVVVAQSAAIFLFFKLGANHQMGMVLDRLIPLGLSYYSFRQIHYAVEAYKQKLPQHTIGDYVKYLFFLPTMLVGPIHLFQDFQRDSRRRRWDAGMFSQGLERILYGFVKITVLGNYLISYHLQNYIFTLEADSWLTTYLDAFRFTANAYFQFAGFSEIAVGLSALMGFRIIENFKFPFLAWNMTDFWNRWHISLSHWCREYVYFPILGYTRKGNIAIVASMLVLGLWHEISSYFIIWAISHAVAINIWHAYNHTSFQKKVRAAIPFHKALGWLLTMHFVMFSFVILKEEDWTAIFQQFQNLLFL